MKLTSRIWIPGSNGFVGKRLSLTLKSTGYSNVFGTGREFDLTDDRAVRAFLEHNRIDVIFMCAAKVGGIAANIKDPYSFLYDNLKIQNNIINFSGENSVKTVVYLGSSCIYPKDYPIQPLKEEFLLASYPEKTNEAYALSKISGLKLCEYANNKFQDTNYICLMPSNLYGPFDHFDSENSHALASLVGRFYKAKQENNRSITVWGTGIPRREWLFIDDLVNCMVWSVDNIKKDTGFVNVGTGEDISMLDLVNLIGNIFEHDYEIVLDKSKPDGMLVKRLDVSKINSLGWKAKTTLAEGLKTTIRWYVDNKK